ncbi:MAG TPA: hypothetical protein VIC71_04550 [Gammaproteobacteria bacterium]|jgi:hypothetical protein
MAAPPNKKIPVLTDVIPADERDADPARASAEPNEPDIEAVIAELQTRLAAQTFALADELMQTAFADMEAKLREQISARLRRELPELIDSLLREHLAREDR